MDSRKQAICDALAAFIRQRPGLEPRNYISHGGDTAGRRAYAAEVRAIGKDKRHAELLLSAVRGCDGITADDMVRAASGGGRLEIVTRHDDPLQVLVTWQTGQYWSVEYRRGTAAYLARLLWDHAREHEMPQPFKVYGSKDDWYAVPDEKRGGKKPVSGGTWLRSHFRRQFGSALQRRWFD